MTTDDVRSAIVHLNAIKVFAERATQHVASGSVVAASLDVDAIERELRDLTAIVPTEARS